MAGFEVSTEGWRRRNHPRLHVTGATATGAGIGTGRHDNAAALTRDAHLACGLCFGPQRGAPRSKARPQGALFGRRG